MVLPKAYNFRPCSLIRLVKALTMMVSLNCHSHQECYLFCCSLLLPLLSVFMFLLFVFTEQNNGGGFGHFLGLKKIFRFLSIFYIVLLATDNLVCFSVCFFCHFNPFLCFDILFLRNKVTVGKKRAFPIWERVFG